MIRKVRFVIAVWLIRLSGKIQWLAISVIPNAGMLKKAIKASQSRQDDTGGQSEAKGASEQPEIARSRGEAYMVPRRWFEKWSERESIPDVGTIEKTPDGTKEQCGKPISQGYFCNLPQGHERQCEHIGQIHKLTATDEQEYKSEERC